MYRPSVRFQFSPSVGMLVAEESLLLAILAIETLLGGIRVRLEAFCLWNAERRECHVDTSTDTGRALCRVFTAFLTHEFGRDQFTIHRDAGFSVRETSPAGNSATLRRPRVASCQAPNRRRRAPATRSTTRKRRNAHD